VCTLPNFWIAACSRRVSRKNNTHEFTHTRTLTNTHTKTHSDKKTSHAWIQWLLQDKNGFLPKSQGPKMGAGEPPSPPPPPQGQGTQMGGRGAPPPPPPIHTHGMLHVRYVSRVEDRVWIERLHTGIYTYTDPNVKSDL